MKTKETDPNLKMLNGLYESLNGLDKNVNDMIGSILSIDTSSMPEETAVHIERLKNCNLPNIVEEMKNGDPIAVANKIAAQWR